MSRVEFVTSVSVNHAGWRHAVVLATGVTGAAVFAWLWPASIHINTWETAAPARVAVLPSPVNLLWALGAAGLAGVAVWMLPVRTGPARADRAYIAGALATLWLAAVPYLPWVPDRLPFLLIFAGPLRWAILAVAMTAAVVRWLRVTGSTTAGLLRFGDRLRRHQPIAIFILSLAIYASLGLWSERATGLHGDEPHYLIIAQSLLADGDLAIENNHRQRDYRSYWAGELYPDYIFRGREGRIYSIHSAGLSALVVPGFALAGARGAVVTAAAAAALAAAAIFILASLVAGPPAAWLVWVALALTVPFVPHAWSLFPEIFATAITGWAMVALAMCAMREGAPRGAGHWLVLGLALGVLPWLHLKFVVLLALTTVCLLACLRTRVKLAAALLLPIAILVVAWVGSFYVMYGTPDPRVPWTGGELPSITLANIPRGLLGLLFDQTFGLLVYAPVYLVALIGGCLLLRDERWRLFTIALAVIAITHVLTSAQLYIWWGGASPPARFLVPILPLFAPFVAAAFARVRAPAVSAAMWTCLGVTLVIAAASVYGLDRRLLFGYRNTPSQVVGLLQGSAPLTSVLAGFTGPDGLAPAIALLPWLAAAALAFMLVWTISRRWRVTRLSLSMTFVLASLVIAAAATGGRVPAETRTASVQRDRQRLLERYDPLVMRAFDYRRSRWIEPAAWLRAAVIFSERDPMARAADPDGIVTGALALPPGRYEAKVWLQGARQGSGALQTTLGRGQLVAHLDGPLDNPAILTFELPIEVPQLWLQLTDPATASRVVRTEVSALRLDAASARPAIRVRRIAVLPAPEQAYVAYVDENTFPERGAYWTRGTREGRVLVASGGATQLIVNLQNGPMTNTVHVDTGFEAFNVPLAPESTHSLTAKIPAPRDLLSVTVQASASFRPFDVDPQSADRRNLGCLVRLELR